MKKGKILSMAAALCMIFAMLLSLNVNVQAAGKADQTANVTINGLAEGTSVSIYKIIDVNIDENDNLTDPMYTWSDAMAAWLEQSGDYGKYLDKSGGENAVSEEYQGLESDLTGVDNTSEITGFYQALGAAIRGESLLTAVDTKTVASGSDSVTFSNLGMGQYIALAEGETKQIYYPIGVNVLPDSNLNLQDTISYAMKSAELTIEKSSDVKSVSNGDTIHYTISAAVPVYPADVDEIHYVIGDNLPEELDLDKASIKVKIKDAQDYLTADTDYVLDTSVAQKFTVTMKAECLKANQGANIEVTYSAKVKIKEVDARYILNEAFLEFNNDPFNADDYTTITDQVRVHTYQITISKVPQSTGGPSLDGVEFTLYDETKTVLKFKKVEGLNMAYILAEDQNDPDAVSALPVYRVANEYYVFDVLGLGEGTYYLKETKGADGYILPSGEIKLTLKSNEDGSLDIQGSEIDKGYYDCVRSESDTDILWLYVYNKSAGDLNLPVTGGAGTVLFTLAGLAVMSGAVILLIISRKRHAR